MQTVIKLSAAVHELTCKQRNREEKKKLSNNAKNNTAIATVGSNNPQRSPLEIQHYLDKLKNKTG